MGRKYGDWEEEWDEGSQAVYYVNNKSGETSWDAPDGLDLTDALLAEPATTSEDYGVEAEVDVHNWTEEVTEEGEVYYFNTESGEVSWDMPAGWSGAGDGADLDPNSDPANWEEYPNEEAEGEVYYFNTVTQEAVWDLPPCLDPSMRGSESAAGKEGAGSSLELGAGATGGRGSRTSPAFDHGPGGGAQQKEDGGKGGKSGGGPGGLDDSIDNVSDEDRDLDQTYEWDGDKEESTFTKITKKDASIQDICNAVEAFSIEEFAESNFNYERKGLRSHAAVDKILCWKDEPLETSLIIQEDREVSTTAVQLFHHVMSYMNDRKSMHSATDHAIAIINILYRECNLNDALTDEICMQICKQTTNNPSYESNDRGWTLLLVVLTCFSPSQNLMPYLLSYCVGNINADIGECATLAKRVLLVCPKSFRLGRRLDVPAPMELEALHGLEDLSVRIYFLDGRFTHTLINSWTTVCDIVVDLATKLGCLSHDPYWLFEVEEDGSERLLDENDRVLDVLASWHVTVDGGYTDESLPTLVYKVHVCVCVCGPY